MKHLRKIIPFFLVLALFSCNSDESSKNIVSGADYLPLKKGLYHVYDVNEVVYELGVPETLDYKLKMIVADSFRTSEGSYTHVIQRSRWNSVANQWDNLDTWSVRINDKEAVRFEGNIPYVVLSFPAVVGKQWNGNSYNNKVNPNTNTNLDEYSIESVQQSYSVEGTTYPDCLVVNQEDNEEFIVYHDKRFEVYSKNVGLIYQEINQLNYCTDENCIGQQKVEYGIIYKQSLKEYGKE